MNEPLNRRDALKLAMVASVAGLAPRVQAAEAKAFPAKEARESASAASAVLTPLNRFGRMMQEYYVRRVREAEKLGAARRAKIISKSDAEAYVREVREKIAQSFGAFPAKTPLNAKVANVVERDAYRIENVIFESRPGFPVTANLYVPKGRTGKMPGVIGTCGHAANGKASEPYQAFVQGLARQGYVVLIFDPIGQGERLQHVTAGLQPRHGVGVREHLHVGNQQFLVGEFFGAWRAWDGIRALDYLLTRPEVDPKHIGVTGNSGGGTDAVWLCGVDTRWTMAAPSCFVTTFRRNMENELPADIEQCPPRVLAMGLDHADFVAVLAPKPVIILDQEKDFFDARGVEEAYGRLKALYAALGREADVEMFLGPDYHGFSKTVREQMYRKFNGATKASDATIEPALTIEKDEVLWCTPKGQVGEAKPRTVQAFTREAAQALAEKRGKVGGAALTQALNEVLKLPKREGVPEYRILRPDSARRYPKRFAATYAVETEADVFALVYRLNDEELLSRPPRGAKRAVLYVSHRSADAELREEVLIAEVIKAERKAAIFACDVRGIGESQPTTAGVNPNDEYGADYFYAAHGIMLDAPVAGQRTHDLLRVIEWLKANGHTDVHLVAKGWGAIPGTFAALLAPEVTQVTLTQALRSYGEVAESDDYNWPLSALVPDVLRHFDLPDCYRELERKKLRQIDPVGVGGVPA